MTTGELAAEWGVAPPGYRLPAATRVGRVRLQVADLARSIPYYERILGLRALDRARDAAEGAVVLGAADGEPLLELRERPGARRAARQGRLGLYHFAILLPDRAALGRFVRHLAAIGAPAGMADHLVSEAIYLQDPDGLGIEVYADRPRATWRARDRELEMTTDPLDVRGLAEAGGREPWSGMPAGSTMGHIHLHVGDLAAASRFYHEALGFDRVVWSYPGALFLSAGGYHHHLGTNTWAAGAPPAGDDDARLLDWELVLPGGDDVESAARSLAAAGHVVERPDGVALVADPWGTRVRLVAARARMTTNDDSLTIGDVETMTGRTTR